MSCCCLTLIIVAVVCKTYDSHKMFARLFYSLRETNARIDRQLFHPKNRRKNTSALRMHCDLQILSANRKENGHVENSLCGVTAQALEVITTND